MTDPSALDRARLPSPPSPLILFGAHDRHNFGDLLFAQMAATRLGSRPLRIAGMVERDLRAPAGRPAPARRGHARQAGLLCRDLGRCRTAWLCRTGAARVRARRALAAGHGPRLARIAARLATRAARSCTELAATLDAAPETPTSALRQRLASGLRHADTL